MTDLAETESAAHPDGAGVLAPPGPSLPPPPPSGVAPPVTTLPPPTGSAPPPPPPPSVAPTVAPTVAAAPAIPAAPTVPASPTVPAAPTVPVTPSSGTVPEYRPPTAPAVPTAAAAMPPVAAPATGLPGYGALTPTTAKPARRARGRSFGRALFVLLLLGGLGAAGYVYGPELLDRVRDEQAGAPNGTEEVAAPLAFPSPTAPPMEVRNATFVVDGIEADGAIRRYEVTTDFETRVSRVLIDREDLPTLEVMTFLDSAVVRRVDQDVWYQTPRGQFPLDDQLERHRWVRHLDELIPAVNRPAAAIEASTTALLAGERMRHLVITIDPQLLAGPSLPGGAPAGPLVEGPTDDLAADDAAAADPGAVDESVAEPAAEVAASAGTDAAADPAAQQAVAVPGVPAGTPPAGAVPAQISIELWIDSRGLVRQLVTPGALGGDVLTVTAISPDAWIPDFPTEDQIEPLTASALVELGL